MGISPSLEKMQITAFSDAQFKKQVGNISVFINPGSYNRSYEIVYDTAQGQGSSAGSPNYNKTLSDTVKFTLVFDGTGVISSALPGVIPFLEDGIKKQIDAFLALVFKYNGNIHSPNFLQLSWGTLLFNCRMKSLDIAYTLFKPDGTPLRARASAKFVSFRSEKDIALLAGKQSPDLSKAVTVKAGDTLPLLCYEVYGSSVYYLDVARVNNLSDVRDLVPGTQLLFPPLQDSAA
ncbi:MAG: hypothetical protein WDN03_08930 [Rhizomicrobium sp.]